MSSALYTLGRWAVAHRRHVFLAWAVGLVALGALAGVLQRGTSDVFTIPGTEAQRASDSLSARFPQFAGASGQVVITAPTGQRVTDPPVRARIEALTTRYAALPHVRSAASPFDEHLRGTISDDGSTAILNVQLDVDSALVTPEIRRPVTDLAATSTAEGLPALVGGSMFMPTAPEMSITEGLGVLIAVGVLLLTFGSMLAAGIPLITSLAGVAASMALILLATRFTDVTSTAPFLALMIGLAVGIDYALFVLSRHRDLLAQGRAPAEAAAEATGTAGSAVVFAGATVAIALLALGVAGIPFLTVMGIAAAVSVVVAVLGALTLLPALLGAAGLRLLPRHVADAHEARRHTGWAAGWVRAATKLPALTVLLVLAALGALALPARDLALALPDNGTSAPTSTQRQAYDQMARAFGPGANAPLVVTLDIVSTTDPLGVVAEVERLVQATPGIARTTVATPNQGADTGVIVAIPAGGPNSTQAKEALVGLRALAPTVQARFGVSLAVTGHAAAQADITTQLRDALVPFGVVVVGLSLVLLMLVFRSVLVPVTAALGYLLSVGSAFGVTVAVCQWGWLAGPLGVTQAGPLIAFMPIIVMGVLFGLAMDYQVFLVSSMRARYVHEGDAHAAVTHGFIDAAKVVTAAGFIMVAVFAAFVPQGAIYIKPIALGLAVGVFVDAFVVRLTLVPALMRLLGRAAWWLPAWLDRRLPVLDVEGESLHRRLTLARELAGSQPPALVARGLGLHDAGGPVYAAVDLVTAPGSLLVVHGPAGSGKTSLLLTLAARMRHTDGELEVAGRLLPDEAASVRRLAGLAEVAGVNDLDPLLTVGDHLDERLASATWHPWVSAAARDEATATLTTLLAFAARAGTGLGPRAGAERDDAVHVRADVSWRTRVRELSALERWVLGVALALVGRPAVVLVDDVDALRGPADRAAAWAVLAALPGLVERPDLTVVATCHDPADARTVCRVLASGAAPLVELALPRRDGTDHFPATQPALPTAFDDSFQVTR